MTGPTFRLEGALPGGTTVLEASAGTGKTFAIAHLVLRSIADEGTPLDRILVVTFTNAAAAELRDRIQRRLMQALEALDAAERCAADELAAQSFADTPREPFDPTLARWALGRVRGGELERASARIGLALAAFDQHRIGTIHSFCQRILGRHAFESGADFDAELLVDVEPACRQAAFDFLALRIAAGEPALRERPSAVLEVDFLTKLARSAVAVPDAPVEPPRPPDGGDHDLAPLRALHAEVLASWSRDREHVRGVLREAMDAGAAHANKRLTKPAIADASFRALDRWLTRLPLLPAALAKDALQLTGEGGVALFHKAAASLWCGRLACGFLDAFDRYRVAFEAYGAYVDARELGCLHDFVAFARASVAEQKRAARVHTFDDLLGSVERALRGEGGAALVERIREDHEVALIDEFQDTDPVQWSIFRRVFHEAGRRLVLIGDPKQAIYAFRGADLATYVRARREATSSYSLDTNHRSDGALLDAIEAVYAASAAPFGAASSPEDAIHFVPVKAARSRSRLLVGGEHPPPIRLLPAQPVAATDAADDDSDDAAEREADGDDTSARELHPIARDVASFLRSDARILEDAVARPVRPRDCAVLARGHGDARRIRRDLRALGVAAVVRTEQSVYSTDDARELELVLRAALLPSDRSALASALSTDLVGAKLGAIAALATDEAELDRWHGRVRALGAALRERGFAAFFRELLATFDVRNRLLGGRDGERRVANLQHLGELLHADAEQMHLGPEALVARLGRLRTEKGGADDRRIRLESDADAVEIVTIHVAKGLEWGVVWCSSLGMPAKPPDAPACITRDEHGAPTLHLGPARRFKARPELSERIKDAMRAEELRLAYVALTRAKHRVNVRGPAARTLDDPFAALFLARRELPITLGKPRKATSKKGAAKPDAVDGLLVPDAAAAALAVEQGLLGHVVVARDGDCPVAAEPNAPQAAPALSVRAFTRPTPLDLQWRITSYTGLSAHAGFDRERLGFDDEAPASAIEPSEDDSAWTGFTGGKALGTRVHDALEHAAGFDEEAIRSALPSGDDTEREALARLLARSLATPLFEGETFALASLPVDSMLREVAFALPVGGGRAAGKGDGLTARRLAEVFERHARPTMPASYAARVAMLALSPELRGFLVGAIDLVFEHEGRIYVADYKTTRLGRTRAAYARERLPAEMVERDYTLQALIYALAVHRHLSRREPGYRYDDRFGGVMHLFLRAMDPDVGPTSGIYFDRPPLAQIEDFERALGIEEQRP